MNGSAVVLRPGYYKDGFARVETQRGRRRGLDELCADPGVSKDRRPFRDSPALTMQCGFLNSLYLNRQDHQTPEIDIPGVEDFIGA
jgi:hypothetical protein